MNSMCAKWKRAKPLRGWLYLSPCCQQSFASMWLVWQKSLFVKSVFDNCTIWKCSFGTELERISKCIPRVGIKCSGFIPRCVASVNCTCICCKPSFPSLLTAAALTAATHLIVSTWCHPSVQSQKYTPLQRPNASPHSISHNNAENTYYAFKQEDPNSQPFPLWSLILRTN